MNVIVNADDFGMSHRVNLAIDYCFKKGIISSTTIIANMPGFDEAINLAYIGKYDKCIGIHFNLVEGEPLSSPIKYCNRICKNGKFIYKRNSVLFWNKREREAIREEFITQIEACRSKGILLSHCDSHCHIHTELPIFLIMYKTLKYYGIKKIRIPLNRGNNSSLLKKVYKFIFIRVLRSLGFVTTSYFSSLYAAINSNSDKWVELMCHPIMHENILYDHVEGVVINKYPLNLKNYTQLL
ncbi:carbohydrate deacetylase [Butyricimonas virosa]|mgnify:CR=1 FL=1